jgi:tetrahydromethanopterin S-methyltransferase subunit G
MTGKILNMPNDIAEMKNTLDNIQNKLENKLTSKSNSKDYPMYG